MSALTSLLVRDDAVSVRQIEEALARQVVDGGELDTALLELAALPENKLIAYRAASERGQPATREQVMSASSATRALLPGDLAIALQVSPLSHEDKTLTVAAVRTLKPSEIAQLAERTGMQIQVRITSELRVLAALERFYGHALLPRHAVLLNRVDAQVPGELVSVEPMQAAVSRASMKTEQLPAFEEAEDFQAVLAAAFERASMSPHAGTPAVDPDETRPLSAKRAFETQKRRTRPPEETAKLGSGLIQARPAQSSVRMSTVAKTPEPSESVESLQLPARAPAPSPVQRPQPEAAQVAPQPKAAQPEPQPEAAQVSPQPKAAQSEPQANAAQAEPQANAAQAESQPKAAQPDLQSEAAQSDPQPRAAQSDLQPRAAQSDLQSRAAQSDLQPKAARPAVPKLSMADAQGALSTVEDRDAVLDIYFRYARQMFDATVLFTLKDGRAIGAHAHNIKSASDIRDVSSPVVRGSALEELTRTLLPRVMDLGRKDEDRALVTGIKRLERQPAALVPICIKRRVVAVLYGDRGGEPLHLDELTDLLTLMPHVTVAFERIIRARKALGLTGTPSLIGELSHAPTQRSMPAVQGFNSDARTTELGEHAMVEALKIPQALPVTKGFGLPDDDGDIYATARIPIQPLPLDQFDSPPRYLSKPPPGTGRYQSLAPKGAGAEEVLRPPSTPSELREERTSSSRRPPPRSDASATSAAPRDQPRSSFAPASSARRPSNLPPAGRRSSAVPPAPNARRSMAPPTNNSASSHPSLAAPKPAPGSGVYSSQVGTTELINMSPVSAGTPASQASQDAASPGQGYLSRAPLAHSPANQNEGGARGGARVSSLPPKAAPETNQVTQLIDALCRSEPNEDPPAIKQLVALGEPALTALLARFPGPLWFDRRKPHARLPLGRDVSPICRALDAFGDQASERLGPVMGSNMTEVRYYATLLAGDRVRPSLLEPMLTRLFDDDPQIRLLVRDALPHYRKFQGFERITERICERARAESAPLYERLAAIDAICVLRDASCVSTLIDLVGHRDKQICVPAHRALTLITCQDFGKTPRKWRSWLSNNSERHRVEWLIEGLMHSEEPMRATAGLELQKLTQVYYGYVAAASKREREAAQKRYAEWWRTEGRTRIAT